MGRISGRPRGVPMAAYGENLMATHRALPGLDCVAGRRPAAGGLDVEQPGQIAAGELRSRDEVASAAESHVLWRHGRGIARSKQTPRRTRNISHRLDEHDAVAVLQPHVQQNSMGEGADATRALRHERSGHCGRMGRSIMEPSRLVHGDNARTSCGDSRVYNPTFSSPRLSTSPQPAPNAG
jgi:hypothetical protein